MPPVVCRETFVVHCQPETGGCWQVRSEVASILLRSAALKQTRLARLIFAEFLKRLQTPERFFNIPVSIDYLILNQALSSGMSFDCHHHLLHRH
jgi:hypothetical protein